MEIQLLTIAESNKTNYGKPFSRQQIFLFFVSFYSLPMYLKLFMLKNTKHLLQNFYAKMQTKQVLFIIFFFGLVYGCIGRYGLFRHTIHLVSLLYMRLGFGIFKCGAWFIIMKLYRKECWCSFQVSTDSTERIWAKCK